MLVVKRFSVKKIRARPKFNMQCLIVAVILLEKQRYRYPKTVHLVITSVLRKSFHCISYTEVDYRFCWMIYLITSYNFGKNK